MNWREINEAISRCRRTSNPVPCLTALFERIRDGHVAAALGEEHERRGRIDDARRWFTEATRLYPKPEYKVRALAALRRLGASEQPERSETAPAQESVLHIIECSKRKIWDSAAVSTPRFVPAKQAYLGDAIRSWLADPRASTERWLILSARYGFIDPDQPVENYDVTFKLPLTGPIPDDALAAQVRYQVRWADAVPIRQFTRVVVHGHRDYFDRVRTAFAPVGAQVVGDGGQVESAGNDEASIRPPTATRADRSDPTARPITATTAFTWSIERANTVGLALGQLGSQVFANFDRSEPEWPVLQHLAAWPDRALACLTTISLGITDYQLGAGAAAGYWKAVMMEIERRPPSNPKDVIEFMARVCRHPVSSRLADQKLARVEKVLRAWESEHVTRQPVELWRWLAVTLGQPEEAKTVVMAMKLVDLLELAGSGNYLDFGTDIPLPIDLRIARISLTSGLIASAAGGSIDQLMGRAGEIASEHRQVLIEAWRAVARAAGDLQLLRLDSLAWQLAEAAGRSEWESNVTDRLIAAGSSADAARRLAAELNWAAKSER